jgi:hypothetical protein
MNEMNRSNPGMNHILDRTQETLGEAARRGTWSGEQTVRATRPALGKARAATLGWLPVLSLVSAMGLLLLAFTFRASRVESPWAEPFFWIGLLTIIAPIAYRLASSEAERSERIGLVAILGLSLYLVKILHSPYVFTFSDEPVHLYNLQEILRTRFLFRENPILQVTPYYPGLPTAAAAISAISGISPFVSGVLLVGAARLILSLALFLFHEQVSGSARVAGIAALIYTGHTNYLFWSAQFAYESLSLPLTVLLLYLIARNETISRRINQVGWKPALMLLVMAIVITHHLTSYGLILFLVVISVLYTLTAPIYQRRAPSYWILTSFTIVATLAWLLYTANQTFNYLVPVFNSTIQSIVAVTVTGELGRELFQSNAGVISPLWEQFLGFSYIIFLLIAMPFGLLRIIRNYGDNVLAITLAGAAILYFPLLGLRFTAAGWEPSNRSAAYLFVGISFVMALGIEHYLLSRRPGWLRTALFTGFVSIIFMGGVIAGWLPRLRLSHPYLLSAGEQVIEPQGVQAARWAAQFLGPGRRIAVDESNARQLLVLGNQYSLTGDVGGIKRLIQTGELQPGEVYTIDVMDVEYIVFDRRLNSWDNMLGMYFNPIEGRYESIWITPNAYLKFDAEPEVSRLYDSGNIKIYDVRGLRNEAQ